MRRRYSLILIALVLLAGVPVLRGVEQPAAPRAPADLASLRQARVTIAKQALEVLGRQRNSGVAQADAPALQAEWERRLFDAELAAADGNPARVAAAERYVAATRKRADSAKSQYDAALVPYTDVLRFKYDLAAAECTLAELKAR
jgi:hypothetical protein